MVCLACEPGLWAQPHLGHGLDNVGVPGTWASPTWAMVWTMLLCLACEPSPTWAMVWTMLVCLACEPALPGPWSGQCWCAWPVSQPYLGHGLDDVGVPGLHGLQHLTELHERHIWRITGLEGADVAEALCIPVLPTNRIFYIKELRGTIICFFFSNNWVRSCKSSFFFLTTTEP